MTKFDSNKYCNGGFDVEIWDKTFHFEAKNGNEADINTRKFFGLTTVLMQINQALETLDKLQQQPADSPFSRDDVPNYILERLESRLIIAKRLALQATEVALNATQSEHMADFTMTMINSALEETIPFDNENVGANVEGEEKPW